MSAVTGAAAQFFVCLADRSWVPGYLASRGFGPEIWRWWGVGYAPAAWTGLTDHLRDLGFADSAIRAAGLARRSARGPLIDMFRNRVMFPVHSPDGAVAGFIGRARPGAGASVPVYLNSPATRLYRKSALLLGCYQGQSALAAGAVAVITEGPLDAIAVTAAAPARYAGMALCGAALTRGHARLLDGSGRVAVAFDADRAGRRAAVRAFPLLRDVADDIWTVRFPAGMDPASYFRAHGGAALAGLFEHQARPLADLVIDETVAEFDRWAGFTDGKFLALRAVAPLIAGLPPGQVARQVARVADRLNLTYAEVTEAVTTALSLSPSPTGPLRITGPQRVVPLPWRAPGVRVTPRSGGARRRPGGPCRRNGCILPGFARFAEPFGKQRGSWRPPPGAPHRSGRPGRRLGRRPARRNS